MKKIWFGVLVGFTVAIPLKFLSPLIDAILLSLITSVPLPELTLRSVGPVVGFLTALVGGYVCAIISNQKPILTSFILGLILAFTPLIVIGRQKFALQPFLILFVLPALCGTLLGGFLRAMQKRSAQPGNPADAATSGPHR